MRGGNGDDTCDVDDTGDLVIEQIGEGNDKVRSGDIDLDQVNLANIGKLILPGSADLNTAGDSAK